MTYTSTGSHTITARYSGGGSDEASTSASLTQRVNQSQLVGFFSSTVHRVEGQLSSGCLATFTDTNTVISASQLHATISWGDGTTSAGTVSGSNGHLTVSGNHTYSLPGRYTVQTTIRDDAPGTAGATTTSTMLVMVPASSSGITVETFGTTSCTSVASSTKVTSSGAPSGTFAFRDERSGGGPCRAYRVGVMTLQAVGIDAVICTSHSTASIYGRAKQGTYPNSNAATVSFRADVAITGQTTPFNGTVRVQTSSGYTAGAVPAAVRITGC